MRQQSPARSCRARAASARLRRLRSRASSGGASADATGATARTTMASTRRGSRSALRSTMTTPWGKVVATLAAASSARRVLPAPPGPTKVNRRGSPAVSTSHSDAKACSRPTKVVMGVGGARRGRRFLGALPGVREPLGEHEREVVEHEPVQLLGIGEGLVRRGVLVPQPRQHLVQPGLQVRRRPLDVDQAWHAARTRRTRPRGRRSPCPGRPSRSSASRSPGTRRTARGRTGTRLAGGGAERPSSNMTGDNRSCSTAARTARRSSASSPSVEETKTRSRWSGVRIALPVIERSMAARPRSTVPFGTVALASR